MPGWHRGSLAIHGDDGRRYVNDSYGGRDFTSAFVRGSTYGVGMKIHRLDPAASSVFFTCDGVVVGGWDLFEETDAEDEVAAIAHTVFPVPKQPPPLPESMFGHASSPSSSMQAHEEGSSATLDADEDPEGEGEKINDEDEEKKKDDLENTPSAVANISSSTTATTTLPRQIVAQLDAIKTQLRHFSSNPPHTIQRLAELLLNPLAHYRALASYLHAVDRVVNVTSGTDVYPLPLPVVPDLSAGRDVNNGEDNHHHQNNPAANVSWGNSTSSAPAPALGSDEALGGALLTPVPWLTTTATTATAGAAATTTAIDAAASSSSSSSSTSTSSPPSTSTASNTGSKTASGARIHSEGTQTIDGPNGMGRIETVSVSVNGVPSTGHARGVTQGELLRQEQRAGVIPVSQLSRNRGAGVVSSAAAATSTTSTHIDHVGDDKDVVVDDDQDEVNDSIPHLRGPDHVGVSDTGPQPSTAAGEAGVQMHNIDVEAAVGRRSDAPVRDGSRIEADDNHGSPSTLDDETPSGTKREAEIPLETEAPKRAKEAFDDDDDDDDPSTSPPSTATVADEKMEET
ncbi:hypothetical protein CP532_0198 [Ophiocordyceps camponoti-leonardi (nom. inval.)]|nr:hypothetical protein CP532_0198 [Ophiocordyceps camponoti-leonardi (nom. inval.)]